jgi:hypothetical protein
MERHGAPLFCGYKKARLQRGYDSAQPEQPFLSITKVLESPPHEALSGDEGLHGNNLIASNITKIQILPKG